MTQAGVVLPFITPALVETLSLVDPTLRTALRLRRIELARRLAREAVKNVPVDVLGKYERRIAAMNRVTQEQNL